MFNEIVHLIEKYFPGLLSKGTKKLDGALAQFDTVLHDLKAAERALEGEIARKVQFAKDKEAAFQKFLADHEADKSDLSDKLVQAATVAKNIGALLGK